MSWWLDIREPENDNVSSYLPTPLHFVTLSLVSLRNGFGLSLQHDWQICTLMGNMTFPRNIDIYKGWEKKRCFWHHNSQCPLFWIETQRTLFNSGSNWAQGLALSHFQICNPEHFRYATHNLSDTQPRTISDTQPRTFQIHFWNFNLPQIPRVDWAYQYSDLTVRLIGLYLYWTRAHFLITLPDY